MATKNRGKVLAVFGPGILVAATGVGAGDLATAAFTGSALGLAVLWAVLLGAFMKFVLNEGLARWQLATGSTLLEGFVQRFGKLASWLFLGYLIAWSFLVAAALMSAIGVTCHAMYPLFGAEAVQTNKIFYGVLHSVLAVGLIWVGGYRLFERIMSGCIGVMFAVVVLTAIGLGPPLADVAAGLFVPRIPAGGVPWTVALIGGIGGTVTVLCYGYWIREEGREGTADLDACRADLAVGYIATAIFGVAMVIIGSSLGEMRGGGATLLAAIAERLEATFGSAGPIVKWTFLIGAWAAVFSSLLGVWQSVPYLFADLWTMLQAGPRRPGGVDTRALPYRLYLLAMALIPVAGLAAVNFRTIQKSYAVVGALFVPMLAAVLLILNRQTNLIGSKYMNSLVTSIVLVGILLFFVVVAGQEIYDQIFVEQPSG